ncbi:MAG: hypothetical protein ABSD44_10410 [Terracidiphilus sp.]
MKHLAIPAALFLLCLALPASLSARDKKHDLDLGGMDRAFVGWVALDPESYYDLGYSRAEWEDVISHENLKFHQDMKRQCSGGWTVAGAKDSKDENTAGNDLYIKFSDASFSTGYVLSLSVHFINLKTNSEMASIPAHKYGGHLCGLAACLEQELDEVNRKLEEKLGCAVPER